MRMTVPYNANNYTEFCIYHRVDMDGRGSGAMVNFANTKILKLPVVDKLLQYESGTLVIWTKFDKIEEEAKNFEESFRRLVGESKKHVELVFHRFYDEISIFYNEKRIERRDPFLLNSLGRQQTSHRLLWLLRQSGRGLRS